jgi:hypothetical protein
MTDAGLPAPAAAELGLLRECQDRVLEREGIPMVLSLVSEVEQPVPRVRDRRIRADGQRLARSFDRHRAALAASQRDDDVGCLTSVMQVVSYSDYGRTEARLWQR